VLGQILIDLARLLVDCYWPVDDVQIEVRGLEASKSLIESWLDVFWRVERIPEL